MGDDQFQLYDLVVVVETIEGNCTCSMATGDCFYLKGGKISLPNDADFCLLRTASGYPAIARKTASQPPCRLDGDR